MKPKTREFLNFLLWSADLLRHPTFTNLTDSYETWAYRNGLWRQLAKLEKEGLLQARSEARDRLYCLTERGRLTALGGRDPEQQWGRTWDGRWRLVLFDVPEARNAYRDKLRKYLRAKCFGCLQGSVWISPDPLLDERNALAGGEINVNSLVLLEGSPCAGEKAQDLVGGAWNFDEINSAYTEHLDVLARLPRERLVDTASALVLQRWASEERDAWLTAVSQDPLLPRKLLPEGYLGCHAWDERKKVLAVAHRLTKTFAGPAHDKTLT